MKVMIVGALDLTVDFMDRIVKENWKSDSPVVVITTLAQSAEQALNDVFEQKPQIVLWGSLYRISNKTGLEKMDARDAILEIVRKLKGDAPKIAVCAGYSRGEMQEFFKGTGVEFFLYKENTIDQAELRRFLEYCQQSIVVSA